MLVVFITPGVSGFTVSSVSVTQKGYQPAGTPMTVTAVIGFPRDGGTETFPSSRELAMTTGLAAASGEPVLVLDDQETRMRREKGDSCSFPGCICPTRRYRTFRSG